MQAPAPGLVASTRKLQERLARLRFGPPVAFVYDPLDYARAAHEDYVTRWARPRPEALFLGMNPGPFGMVQTGVPFGEVAAARDWLGIDAAVGRPRREHPKRPVEGYACRRSEVSGRRLWGWARERFGTPERFFSRFFVWNYCPLAFLEESGRNLTPDRLTAAEAMPLFDACDEALREVVAILAPHRIVGVGTFAEKRARRIFGSDGIPIGTILHPSPASPAANRGWEAVVDRQLAGMGIGIG